MNHREKVTREQAVISICIALYWTTKLHHDSYAMKRGRRRSLEVAATLEHRALDAIAHEVSRRFAPFVLYDEGKPYHWQAALVFVREALNLIPAETRAQLASRDNHEAAEHIAKEVFSAVDSRFKLVPLPGNPGMAGYSSWGKIFEAEFGASSEVLR